jgi:hypothetical protein
VADFLTLACAASRFNFIFLFMLARFFFWSSKKIIGTWELEIAINFFPFMDARCNKITALGKVFFN